MRPEIKYSLDEYRDHRVPTGGFLKKVLENDLFLAFAAADEGNIRDMFEIVKYIWNNFPVGIYGSPEEVKNWLERGRQ